MGREGGGEGEREGGREGGKEGRKEGGRKEGGRKEEGGRQGRREGWGEGVFKPTVLCFCRTHSKTGLKIKRPLLVVLIVLMYIKKASFPDREKRERRILVLGQARKLVSIL